MGWVHDRPSPPGTRLNDISSIPSNGNHQRLLISASFRRKGAQDSADAVTVRPYLAGRVPIRL